jgi:uncharacterized protein (TIGR02145 family)
MKILFISKLRSFFILIVIVVFQISSCKKEKKTIQNTSLDSIQTTQIKIISLTSALGKGNYNEYKEFGDEVGICWSIHKNPTINDKKSKTTAITVNFTALMSNLTKNTSYYVRAYVTTALGTSYGNELEFTIPNEMKFPIITDSIFDLEGNNYKTVVIGTQTWMAENLRATKKNDGTIIPNEKDIQISNNLHTSQCTYNYTNNIDSINKYGRLYTWEAITNGKICPQGWHIPTDNEWTILSNYLISNGFNEDSSTTGNKIARSLAATTDWEEGKICGYEQELNNRTGFSALPGGYIYGFKHFSNINEFGYWWSSTESNADNAYYRRIYYNLDNFGKGSFDKNYGLSVRCIKD